MKAKVYDNTGAVCELDLREISDLLLPIDTEFMDGDYLNIFTSQHRIPDVWRYIASVERGAIQIHNVKKSDELANSNYDDSQQ